MKKITMLLFACCLALCVSATQYSKLALITAAKQAGRWTDLKGWIVSAGLMDEFQNCVYLSDDYPQFAAITNAIVSGGAASAAEVETILAASKDPAIADDLLRRAYDSDMRSEGGRKRWHGAVTNTVFDTNALVKVQIHADGYRHVEPYRIAQPRSIDQRIAAAERKALAEAAAKARAEAAAKRRADRIAMLQTNLTAEVSALMARNRWPEDLARLYLQHELNTLIGTVEVSADVSPQGVSDAK